MIPESFFTQFYFLCISITITTDQLQSKHGPQFTLKNVTTYRIVIIAIRLGLCLTHFADHLSITSKHNPKQKRSRRGKTKLKTKI